MNPEHAATNWIPGLMMVGAAIIAGLAYFFGSKGLKATPPSPRNVEDLTVRYQAKLAQLKDHLAQRKLLAPEHWEETKARLEAEAAAILRERDGVKHEGVKAVARAEKKAIAQAKDPSFWNKNPALSGALIGGAVVAFFGYLGLTVSQSAGERGEGMSVTGGQPGAGPMQGNAAAPGQPGEEREDPKLAALAQRVQAGPDDPEAVSQLALYLVRKQAFDDAKPLVDRLALLDPFNVRGRVCRAVFRAVEGDAKGSLDELEHLAATYPDAYDARMFAGLIAMDDNDPGRAVKNLEAYIATAPSSEQPPMMRMILQQLREQLNAPKR
jgi:hypothetical protein